MKKLTFRELSCIEGGSFDCDLAAGSLGLTALGCIFCPPVGLAAGLLTVGGLIAGMAGVSRSCY